MNLKDLLSDARQIWGNDRLNLQQIVIRLGVTYGDLCRAARGADKDKANMDREELKKELGNVIFSTIRWCDDLGLDPEECVRAAMECQRRFVEGNEGR